MSVKQNLFNRLSYRLLSFRERMQGFQTVNTKFKMRTYKYVPKRVFLALVLILIVVFSSKLIFNAIFSYPCVSDDQIMSVLLHKTTPSVENLTDLRPACDYRKLVYENDNFYESIFYLNVSNFDGIQSGGEFTPSHCKPEFSTAIIIPYRNRITQLNRFIAYIHHFLRQQHIHYRIFVIEQADDKPFNRAKLFNVGAVYAINSKFPCLIFHDVDLIPLQLGNLYACAKLPRHMAVNMNKYQYKLPYKRYVGGSISIPAEIYQTINGMSNLVSNLRVWNKVAGTVEE